ncbi:MAG: hypothetical protein FWC87_14915, partial [Acidimicrobiaceae bacterium]|nr:hypothetical protein [Acidimicrobiaceae bacterium]
YVGWYMFYVQHFFINDELNRTADAVFVTVGRDPHLGAIGFYWPPLPQLLNCLFVPILQPLGATIMAGTLQTAFCMALTIPVLAKIGKTLGVGRWTTFGVCLVFAITPVTIYNSANGMSEAAFFLTGSLTMLGFFRYIRSRSTGDMILFSLSMSAFILTRLEGPAVVAVLVVVAAFDWRCLRSWRVLKQRTWTAVLLGLPPLACFLFWILEQWILLKDPLFFLHQNGPSGGAVGGPGDAVWLPHLHHDTIVLLQWAGHWVLVLGMTMAVALLGIVLAPFSNRTRGSIGIIGAMATILVIQVYTVGFADGWGDPRYFSMAVPWAACAALWMASWTRQTAYNPIPSRNPLAGVWNIGLIAIMVVNAGTGNWTMSSGTTTGIEHECAFMQEDVARLLPFLGRGGDPKSKDYCAPASDTLQVVETATHWLDDRLKPNNRVLMDNNALIAPEIFTRHPGQYIVRNDRDWQKIVANPAGKITYLITEAHSKRGKPIAFTATNGGNEDYGATLVNYRSSAWHLVYSKDGAQNITTSRLNWIQIYKVSSTVAPIGIAAPTGQ